jgi:hypothetical protein
LVLLKDNRRQITHIIKYIIIIIIIIIIEVSEDGRIVGGIEWQGKVYNSEELKKLLRTARNRRILHMPME